MSLRNTIADVNAAQVRREMADAKASLEHVRTTALENYRARMRYLKALLRVLEDEEGGQDAEATAQS